MFIWAPDSVIYSACLDWFYVDKCLWTPLTTHSYVSVSGPLVLTGRSECYSISNNILDNIVLPTLCQQFGESPSTWQCPCAHSGVHKEMLFWIWCGRTGLDWALTSNLFNAFGNWTGNSNPGLIAEDLTQWLNRCKSLQPESFFQLFFHLI